MAETTCSINDCENKTVGRGWCRMHYARWRRTGDPLKVRLVKHGTPEATIDANSEWRDGCLEWTGSVGGPGYPRVTVDGQRKNAHRYVWERHNGAIPTEAYIDHACCNKRCLNIDHLRLATPAQNTYNRKGPTPGRKFDLPRNVYPVNGRGNWEEGSFYVMIRRQKIGGLFSTPEEAAEVAEEARRQMFGTYAGRG